MKNNLNKILYILLFILPSIVYANAGTPMIWFGLLHLVLINAFIGFVESEILTYKKIKNRMWLIIIANYFSMFIGMYFIAPFFSKLFGNVDFWGSQTNDGYYKLRGFFIGMSFSFIGTLLIEFPFFYFSTKVVDLRKKIFLPFFISNTVTYVVMVLFYFVTILF